MDSLEFGDMFDDSCEEENNFTEDQPSSNRQIGEQEETFKVKHSYPRIQQTFKKERLYRRIEREEGGGNGFGEDSGSEFEDEDACNELQEKDAGSNVEQDADGDSEELGILYAYEDVADTHLTTGASLKNNEDFSQGCLEDYCENIKMERTNLNTKEQSFQILHDSNDDEFVNISVDEYSQNRAFEYYSYKKLPSAPPIPESYMQELMHKEPRQWIRDSECPSCMMCWAPFRPIFRTRHHCRLCGGVFCSKCSSKKCILPIKFHEREPQRVCDDCHQHLQPLQKTLMKFKSNSAQVATCDVTDWTCFRSWINLPISMSMDQEIYKATNVLCSYTKMGNLISERRISEKVLKGAKGFAILTMAKAGAIMTYKLGTGLVVVKKNYSWSPPSAIASFGVGWGLQAGGELNDLLIVLHDEKSIQVFKNSLNISLGVDISAAVGFFGRLAGADICTGLSGLSTCYTYSSSKGAFVGLSLEGTIITARTDLNAKFYGDPHICPSDILFGTVEKPVAAAPLYQALDYLIDNFKMTSLK